MKNCLTAKLKRQDKLVICIGENDHDSSSTLSHLRALREKFTNNTIIILSIKKNNYVNIKKLNIELHEFCNHYQNCHFVDCMRKNVSEVCNSINYIIDCKDYTDKFINLSELKNLLPAKVNRITNRKSLVMQRKGTIPYFFARMRSKLAEEINAIPAASTECSQNKIPKKGTITHYFPVVNKKCENDMFFRAYNNQ
jgi:hypothetical protein